MTNLFGKAKSVVGNTLNSFLFAKADDAVQEEKPATDPSSSVSQPYKFFKLKNHRLSAPAANGNGRPPGRYAMMQTGSPRLTNPAHDRTCQHCGKEGAGIRCPHCNKLSHQQRISHLPSVPYRPLNQRSASAPKTAEPAADVVDVELSDDNEDPIPVASGSSNGTTPDVPRIEIRRPQTVEWMNQTVYLGTMTGMADIILSDELVTLKNLTVKNQDGKEKLNIRIPANDITSFCFFMGSDTSHVDRAFYAFVKLRSRPATDIMESLHVPLEQWSSYRLQPTDADEKHHYIAFKTKCHDDIRRIVASMASLSKVHEWDRQKAKLLYTRIKNLNEALLSSMSQLDDIRSVQKDRFDLIKEETKSVIVASSDLMPVRTYAGSSARRSITKKSAPVVVDLDDDESDAMCVDELSSLSPRPKRSRSVESSPNDHQVMVRYPPSSQDPVTVLRQDLKCLQEGEYLNDNILEFYLNYILHHPGMIPDDVRQKTLLFNSFFFNKLTSKAKPGEVDVGRDRHHQKIKKWLRHEDVFSKDFLIVPVNRNKHWFLLIVCYHNLVPDFVEVEPSASTSNPRSPCILLMDSLGAIRNGGRFKLTDPLRNMLEMEWQEKKGTSKAFDQDSIPDRRIKVTEQDNYYDCGLYVLQYVEQFLKDPSVILASEDSDFRHWIDRRVMNEKRGKIQDIIERIYNTQTESKEESIE